MPRKYEKNTAYQKFVNEILDDMIMANSKVVGDYIFYENNCQFTIFTTIGIIDYYPTTDKVQIRNKLTWRGNGLVEIFKALGIKGKGQDKSRYQELYNYMSKEHNLVLLESEMQEIINIVKRIK